MNGQNPWYTPGKLLEVGQGNNAFSLPLKADRSKLTITPLKIGKLDELNVGKHIAFQDFEGERWQDCVGLESAILCLNFPIPIYIFDNHNHVFYAWCEALKMGWFEKGAVLVHMDEHFDASMPPLIPAQSDLKSLENVWRFTNETLQIATYIKPALTLEIFSECVDYVESSQFAVRNQQSMDIVLNLDIDVFHSDMNHISWQQKIDVLKYYLPRVKLITIATSPYFIDQHKAIDLIKKVIGELF